MNKTILILSVVVMTAMMVGSCGGDASKVEGVSSNEEIVSNEKKLSKVETTPNEKVVFNEVTIGNQVWMTKNLNVDKFRNGEPIPNAKTVEEWEKAGENGEPVECYYDNDPA